MTFVPVGTHRWCAALTAYLDEGQAQRFGKRLKGSGRPPALIQPSAVLDVYCRDCHRSWGDVGEVCEGKRYWGMRKPANERQPRGETDGDERQPQERQRRKTTSPGRRRASRAS